MRFAFGKALFVTFGVEVTAGVRSVDFIHEVDGAVVLAEFIFGIDKDQAAFCCDFRTAFEECERVFFQQFVFFRSSQALGQDFFFGDVGIVFANLGFSGRVMMGSGNFWFSFIPSGNFTPQISRTPLL